MNSLIREKISTFQQESRPALYTFLNGVLMKRKRKTKLPKDNGRPQLWMRDTSELLKDRRGSEYFFIERLRIIYPNGKVEYADGCEVLFWDTPCWRDRKGSVKKLTERMLAYDECHGCKTIFLGYL